MYKKNYLTYPTKVMNITQNYSNSYSHKPHSTGNPADYPIDEACQDSGRDYFYCPCDEVMIVHIYGVGKSGTNTIWLQSTSKVVMPYGEDYVTILVTHPNDDDLSKLYEGKKFTRGQTLFREGNDGNATGYHFHIAVGTGKFTGSGWVQNSKGSWVNKTTGIQLKPEQAFYVDKSFTTVKYTNGINFVNLPDNTKKEDNVVATTPTNSIYLVPNKTRTEYGLVIKEKIIPDGNKNKPNRKLTSGTPKYITIHNTARITVNPATTCAEQYVRATYNGNMGGVSVHYYIDDKDCWQMLAENEIGYHAADGYSGPGNTTSLAIEIIMDGSGKDYDTKAEDRGALLAAILLYRHGLTMNELTTHNRWYPKKYCPTYILPHWTTFYNKVKTYYNNIKKQNSMTEEKPTDNNNKTGDSKILYRVQVGAFSVKANADKYAKEIKSKGFEALVKKIDNLYKVQCGAYSVKKNAEALVSELSKAGYKNAIIVYDKIEDTGKKDPSQYVVGDLDGDGKVTSADARLALRASVGLDKLTDEQVKRGDMDGDKKITSADARLILRKSVGLD